MREASTRGERVAESRDLLGFSALPNNAADAASAPGWHVVPIRCRRSVVVSILPTSIHTSSAAKRRIRWLPLCASSDVNLALIRAQQSANDEEIPPTQRCAGQRTLNNSGTPSTASRLSTKAELRTWRYAFGPRRYPRRARSMRLRRRRKRWHLRGSLAGKPRLVQR
jgi:hypothetical protein